MPAWSECEPTNAERAMTDMTTRERLARRAAGVNIEGGVLEEAVPSVLVYRMVDAILDELMKPGEPTATIMLKEMIRCIHNPQINSGMRADAPEIVLRAVLTHIKAGK